METRKKSGKKNDASQAEETSANGFNSSLLNFQKHVDDKFDSLFELLHATKNELSNDLNAFKEELSLKVSTIEKSVDILEGEVFDLKNVIDKLLQDKSILEEMISNLENDILQMDAYSRRENLLFFGLPEPADEDTEKTLRNFIKVDLKLKDEEIEFQRVHRLGKTSTGKKSPRPIIARFLRYPDVEMVKEAAYKRRKGSKGGVTEDIPWKWYKARKEKAALVKDAKASGKRVRWKKDILYIDGVPTS